MYTFVGSSCTTRPYCSNRFSLVCFRGFPLLCLLLTFVHNQNIFWTEGIRCELNNGDCDYYCLEKTKDEGVCKCPIGKLTTGDNRRCASGKQWFNLFKFSVREHPFNLKGGRGGGGRGFFL